MDFLMYFLIFILGAIAGSYLNSWMWRVHEGKWTFGGRSQCIHCARQLAWYENIPFVSYILLRGKCRTCKGKIPPGYFWVELLTGIFFVKAAMFHIYFTSFNPLEFFRDIFFIVLLIVVFVYDLNYQIILSGVVWSGTIIALGINLFIFRSSVFGLLLGMAVGGGFFLLQYVVSKGRWIGGGDVRFGVMMGALLGWPNILVALFVSYVLGALVSLPLILAKKTTMKSEIPFGTFLAVGTFATMFWGNQIVSWYLSLLSF